jgi:hypothetical protein
MPRGENIRGEWTGEGEKKKSERTPMGVVGALVRPAYTVVLILSGPHGYPSALTSQASWTNPM